MFKYNLIYLYFFVSEKIIVNLFFCYWGVWGVIVV